MKLSRVLKVALLSTFFCLSNSYSKEEAEYEKTFSAKHEEHKREVGPVNATKSLEMFKSGNARFILGATRLSGT